MAIYQTLHIIKNKPQHTWIIIKIDQILGYKENFSKFHQVEVL